MTPLATPGWGRAATSERNLFVSDQRFDSQSRRATVPDLPLIIEQLQDQLDQLRATIEAQQVVIDQHDARLSALERP